MTTVNDLRNLFNDTWFILVNERDEEIFAERRINKCDISEYANCKVKLAYPTTEDGFDQIVCQIDSEDPNYPKRRRYEFNGTWTYVVEANSLKEAQCIFAGVYTEELYINDDYDVTEIED